MVKFWTLMSGTSYIASISNPSYTRNPLCAVAYDSIKKADIAANRWKRKNGSSFGLFCRWGKKRTSI